MDSDKSPYGEPHKPKGSAQSLSNYLGGEVTTISEGENDEEHPGAGQTHMMSRFGGAAAGAALAGAAVAAAGLPMATVGAGAAVAGAVVGAVAGRAVSKEWVRGEVVADAMEFDQEDGPKADEAARDEAGANTVQAARSDDDDRNKDKAHIFSVGGHHGHHDNRKA